MFLLHRAFFYKMAKYYGGVEGGGTCSTAVIMDVSGKVLGQAEGEGTNQYLVGLETCCERLDGIIADAKKAVSNLVCVTVSML